MQPDDTPSSGEPRLLFRRRQRLTHDREFAAVLRCRASVTRGPLRIHGLPNKLGVSRLGLSVGRRVGSAVMRNRVKRLLREAFRLEQIALPRGLDLVIAVGPHQVLHLDEYRRSLVSAALDLQALWQRRGARRDPPASETGA